MTGVIVDRIDTISPPGQGRFGLCCNDTCVYVYGGANGDYYMDHMWCFYGIQYIKSILKIILCFCIYILCIN